MNLLSRREVIPVKERNSLEKRLYKKISHFNFGKQLIIDPYLGKQTNRITIDGKIVLPWEELDKCIEKFYTLIKADGARKLYHQIKEHYFGIGEPMIQRYISNNDMQRQKRPLFSNKAPLIPVDTKQPMERHQVDLVDMRKLIVEKDDVSYKYILSTMDVFTRFVWLRPLSDKSSEKVAAKLREIYAEFGNPKILQSDQGSEFKGVVTRLCKDMNIKLIYSSSYHPQSQGKIERSHGTWKDKIRFDLINSKFGGIYNNAVHSSLGISPYECLLGIKPNSVTQKCNFTNTNLEDIPIEFANEESNMTFIPSEDYAERMRHIEKVRSQAFNISKKASANMQKNGLAKYPPSEYNIGDEVYVKFIGKDKRVYRGGSSIAAPRVLKGIVIATNKDLHKYKVKYTTQEKTTSSDWFRELNDIITESRVMSTSYKEAMHDKMIGLQQNAAKEDLHVDKDIPSDGNCMFYALSLQLSRVDVQISYTRLRHMIVDFLRNNPVLDFSDGTVDFRDFTVDVDWNGYLERMERDGEWGDNTVLVAAACLFRIPILILSSLPNSQPIRIIPRDVALEQTLYLGHIAEFHYLSLIPDQAQSIGEHVDCAAHNILCEVLETLDCNTCNSLNNTNEILCHRCGTIHIEIQCLLNSSEDIKQNDRNKDHDKFDVDLDSNTTLDSMLEENLDPDDDNEISVGKPHKGPNDSTDTLHENDILLSNEQNFELINKWLQHKLLEFEDQSFGKGILLSKDDGQWCFITF
ncbi:unnamed protein product [Mytilus coruscus]|uniref:OTU domain-containing protein n=1 Tax=Mytilus coruscus TaxID=42192 RepID=A0A6J8CR68_MYTCO|nr:unnamed protein product [Mytilus coruscus]